MAGGLNRNWSARLLHPLLVYFAGGAATVMALLMLVFFAWRDRDAAFDEAGLIAENVAGVLAEHVHRLLETSDFVLRQAILAAPSDRPHAGSFDVWQDLADLSDAIPYVASILIIDAAGRVALATHEDHPPAPLDPAVSEYFLAQHAGDDRLSIDLERLPGLSDEPLIVLSRPFDAPPGKFHGLAAVALARDFFARFYRGIDIGYATVIEVAKADGGVLVREPPLDADRILVAQKSKAFMSEIALGPAGTYIANSPVDGVDRLNAYRKVEEFDLYVTVGIAISDIRARWIGQLQIYSYFGLAGLAASLILGFLALMWAGREKRARRALARSNELLEARVDARTADLRKVVAEKEILIKEVHHRVKNSLHMISSLLTMQSREVESPVARHQIAEAQSRVMTVARVHERLYRTDHAETVEFAAYLKGLCEEISASHLAASARQTVEVRAAKANVPTAQAVALALIVNELVINALKHAHPDGRAGTVWVAYERLPGGCSRLSVRDDGVGLRHGSGSIDGAGLGMKVVRALVQQMRGTLEVSSGPQGTEFTIILSALPKAR